MATLRFRGFVKDGLLIADAPELWADRLDKLDGKRVEWTLKREQNYRTLSSNKYLWFLYNFLAEETGSDPESLHYGLKHEALRSGILEPQFFLLGDKLIEEEPTTRTDQDTFNHYVNWLKIYAATELGITLPDSDEVTNA